MIPGARALFRMGLASAAAVLVAVFAHLAPVLVGPDAPGSEPGASAVVDSTDGRGAAGGGPLVAGVPARRLSLNRASQADLEALPGIGPALARRILEFRATHGPFRRAEELLLVRGIGPRKWAALRPLVRP